MSDCSYTVVKHVVAHPHADRLDIVVIDGYTCVVGKGDMKVGDNVLHIAPDAKLSDLPCFDAVRGYVSRSGRVKTVRLRNVWSEGICIPIEKLCCNGYKDVNGDFISPTMFVTTDDNTLAEKLGIAHWEAPPSNGSFGTLSPMGGLPYGLGKTDQENVQKMDRELILGKRYLVTRKMDGTSCTLTFHFKDVGEIDEVTCSSRSLMLDMDDMNVYTDATLKIVNYVKSEARRCGIYKRDYILVLRGEVTASNIQRNPINKDCKGFPTFNCYEAYIMDMNDYGRHHEHLILNVTQNNMLTFPKIRWVKFLNVIEQLTEEQIQAYLDAPASDGEGVVLWEVAPQIGMGTFGKTHYDVLPTGMSFKIRSRDYDSKL